MNRSPPGFSIHGILPERTLEWVAISFSKTHEQHRVKYVYNWKVFAWISYSAIKMLHFWGEGSKNTVAMYGCEGWTVKKAERQRIDAFEVWCWRRLLGVPWTARRSNQSILKESSPGISLEGLMLRLKLQYFGHLMRRVDSLKKPLMLGGIGGQEKGTTENEMAGWIWVWVNSRSWWWTGRPGVLQFMGSQRVGHYWETELNWTDL